MFSSKRVALETTRIHGQVKDAVRAQLTALRQAADALSGAVASAVSLTNTPRPPARATLRPALALSPREVAFRASRNATVARALRRILKDDAIDTTCLPTIGIAASGGGTRATVATLASLNSLNQLGLLDSVSYVAGVSGSTWAMACLYAFPGRSPANALNSAKHALTKSLNPSIPSTAPKLALATALDRLKTARTKINLVDLFGVLLTAAFLEGSSESLPPTISDQAHGRVEHGRLPFPIYCAVSNSGDPNACGGEMFQWVEFSPFEMGFISAKDMGQGVWIPMSAFGRAFNNGETVSDDPEVSFGIMLGVLGSAFTANLHRILQELSTEIPPDLYLQLSKLLETHLPHLNTKHPISPSQFPNPSFNLSTFNDPITQSPLLSLMDGGMDSSLPIPALLHPGRKIDIIIVLDASADIGDHPFLERANSFVSRRCCHHPTMTSRLFSNPRQETSSVSAFGTRPEVVYLPLVGDAATAWYAKAANFVWSEGQVDAVASLAGGIVKDKKDEMEALIARVFLLGNATDIAGDPVPFLRGCVSKFGPVFRIRILQREVFVVDASAAKSLFADEALSLSLAGLRTMRFDGYLGDQQHIQHAMAANASLLRTSLQAQALDALSGGIRDTVNEILEELATTRLHRDPPALALQIVAATSAHAFLTPSLAQDERVLRLFTTFFVHAEFVAELSTILPVWLVSLFLLFYSPLHAAKRELTALLKPELKSLRFEQSQNDAIHSPQHEHIGFLESLCTQEANDDVIVTSVLLLIVAAMRNTSIALTNLLYELANDADLQLSLRKEMETAFDHTSLSQMNFTRSNLQKLPLLDSFLRESLYQNAKPVSTVRTATQDTTLSGFLIPKESFVLLFGSTTHGSAFFSTDRCETFIPSRWMNSGTHATTTGPDFVGFGGGRTTCPGRFLGVLEAKVVVCCLVAKFDVRVGEGAGMPEKVFTMKHCLPGVGREGKAVPIEFVVR
ncbi:hypothetical protein HDU98_000791 [Podochytrium sp. JEL0797]|nr:hypothetical protein HDU98_000791 [Podochytrium sp. JEL0797]